MRFDAFEGDAPLDRQPCTFPWKPAVTFHVWRSGRREFAETQRVTDADRQLRSLRLIARQKKLTMKQLREMDGADLQAELEALDVDSALGELGLEGVEADPEQVARLLVHSVDGPLLFTNDGEPLGWHDSDEEAPHAGAYFLTESPQEFTRWVVTEAQRIEMEFQAFMDAAVKNSQDSSVDSEAGEGAAI